MAKRVDPLKAKQAKQKKIAIVLGVVLVAVVAFQGPKTLKMLQGPQPVAAPATTTPTASTPAPAATGPTGGTPAAPTGTPPVAQPAVLADSDLPPAAGDGQLESFELFRSKDPFAQQVDENAAGSTGNSAGGSGSDEPRELHPIAVDAPPTQGAVTGGAPDAPNAPSAPSAPAAPEKPGVELASETSISVNGKAEAVEVRATFPLDEPTFQLVSIARDGKSVRIAVAGGSYADGSPTIELELRKPLTLQNTADGSRYVLELKTVEGFAPPKGK
jgi:hypothetical protein